MTAMLPADFAATMEKIQRYNIIDESPEQIRARLDLAVKGVAAVHLGTMDMGVKDWSERLIKQFVTGVHKEICDSEKGCLNDKYAKLMDSALTPDGVQSVATVVVGILTKINPAFAVSSIAIYIALWVLKIGLNRWCAMPQNTAA